MRSLGAIALGFALLVVPVGVRAQGAGQSTAKSRRVRLILKDGTYQLVLGYQVVGKLVRYKSAERNGEMEEIPVDLVDLPATEAWVRSQGVGTAETGRAVLSPELAKEEAERAAKTPEILPGLKLPEEVSLLVLDQYKGMPELVPMQQEGGDLNKETSHNVLKQPIHPASAAHDILELRGVSADVQLHTMMPAFYVRIGSDDEGDAGGAAGSSGGGSAIMVDTHGGSGRETPTGGAIASGYVLEKLSVRMDAREVESFRIASLGVRAQPDVIETRAETVPGGKWMKLTPLATLEVGEYALVEVLSANEVNLGVWDFGVHPQARESVEAMRPEAEKAVGLERRDK